jgi:hypothetical protein
MPQREDRRRLIALGVVVLILVATPLAVVASNAFTDVPTSNTHHDDITWLADSGVTKGCNPPANDRYCPDDSVSRDQMASFMRRLAEGRVVDAATAAEAENSEQLDGKDSVAYQTLVAGARCNVNASVSATSCGPNSNGTIPDETTVELLEFEMTTPAAGVAEVAAHIFGETIGWVTLDEACAPFTDVPGSISQATGGLVLASEQGLPNSATALISVPQGSHTFRMCVAYPFTDGGGSILISNLTARWTAGGSVSLQGEASESGSPLDIPLGD